MVRKAQWTDTYHNDRIPRHAPLWMTVQADVLVSDDDTSTAAFTSNVRGGYDISRCIRMSLSEKNTQNAAEIERVHYKL